MSTISRPNPTIQSNWVFEGSLALGAYPDPKSFFWQLLDQGFNTFVCLQPDEELKSFRPYKHLLPRVPLEKPSPEVEASRGGLGGVVIDEEGVESWNPSWAKEAAYIQFGQVDNDATASDDDLVAFVDRLSALLDNPSTKMYLHCWGGHGRSGSVAVLLLIKRQGLTLDEAIAEANKQHETRQHNPHAKIPQSQVQMEQLRRIYERSKSAIAVGYWSIRGLGAPLRMIVMYSGAALKADCYDCKMSEDGSDDRSRWLIQAKPALKDRNALMNLPYVIDGDIVVSQSNACASYLGRKFGMMGETIQEASHIEQLLCEAYDVRSGVISFAYGRDPSPFDKYIVNATAANGSLDKLNLWLCRKISITGFPEFFVGKSASVADFFIWEMLDQISSMAGFFKGSDPFIHLPFLGDFLSRFRALPNNARYFSSKLSILPCNNVSAKTYGGTPSGAVCSPDLERHWQDSGNASGVY